MGFDASRKGNVAFNSPQPMGKQTINRGDEVCPECGGAMKTKTLIAVLPRGTHNDIRKVHAFCVPVESPTYQLARQVLLGTVEE